MNSNRVFKSKGGWPDLGNNPWPLRQHRSAEGSWPLSTQAPQRGLFAFIVAGICALSFCAGHRPQFRELMFGKITRLSKAPSRPPIVDLESWLKMNWLKRVSQEVFLVPRTDLRPESIAYRVTVKDVQVNPCSYIVVVWRDISSISPENASILFRFSRSFIPRGSAGDRPEPAKKFGIVDAMIWSRSRDEARVKAILLSLKPFLTRDQRAFSPP
jgi:hypothetical protein